jgi:phosphatidylserine/phosphatidylglycerophosphate/cardiolipin synthase-like enzyme
MTFSEITSRFLPVNSGTPFQVHEDDSLATPLVDGEEYFTAVRMAMGRATSSGDAIYLLGWRFDADFRFSLDPADNVRLGPVLAEKAATGVDVRLIMSAKWQLLDYLQAHTEKELGDERNNDLDNVLRWFGPAGNIGQGHALRHLTVAGRTPLAGRVLFDYRGEVTGVHHQKCVVIVRGDTVTAFLGGIDFLGDRLDTARHDSSLPRRNPTKPEDTLNYYWHDAGVMLEGSAAFDVLGVFLRRWEACSRQPNRRYQLKDGLNIQPALNPTIEASGLRAGKITTPATRMKAAYVALNFPEHDAAGADPLDDSTASSYGTIHTVGVMYAKAIRAAHKYIYLEDQYVAAPAALFPVLGDAIRRGVKVIAVLGGYDDDTQASVEPKVTGALGDFLTALGTASSGARVFHVRETIVHSKLMVVDDKFFAIGSANFSDRSMSETTDTSALGNLLKNFNKKVGATDSELHVGIVDDRPPEQNAALALRIRLWAEHLRVNQWDPATRADLIDLSRALSIFSTAWGKPVRFSYPKSRLVPAAQ